MECLKCKVDFVDDRCPKCRSFYTSGVIDTARYRDDEMPYESLLTNLELAAEGGDDLAGFARDYIAKLRAGLYPS